MAVFVVTDRGFHGDRLFGDLQYLEYLLFRHFHPFAQLFRGGLAAHFLQHLARHAIEFVDGLNHVHRNPDGAGLVGDGTGDGLPDPPGSVGRELVPTAVFKLIHGFHQANVAFLDQVQELQATVGVFLGNRNNQTQVGLNHLFLGTTGLGFADGNAAVDFLDVGDGEVNVGLYVLDAFLQAYDFIDVLTNSSRVGLFGGGDFAGPLQVGFVAGEPLDEVLAGHFAVAYADLHDGPFVLPHHVVGGANQVHQFVKGFVAEFERCKHLAQFVQGFLGFLVGAAMLGKRFLGYLKLFCQQFKAQPGLFRVRAVFRLFIGGIVFVIGGIGLFGGLFRDLFGHERFGVVRVEETADDVGDAAFILNDALVSLDDGGDGAGEVSHGGHHVANAFFDAFGDHNLAFAGQQLNGTHFTHVHAYGIGGAAGIGFNRGQSGGGFCGCGFVSGGVAFGH